jgi:Ca-activated chloride channel family protein
MTEQRERTELLRLIQQRPRNVKVFCIGVGNDVNKPLLEQIADDSGGIAAFLSPGDDFRRQAKAFRRKLMSPVATDVKIDFSGIEVTAVEPQQLPNLYHGAPVRLYGRYRGTGPGKVRVRASVNGVAWESGAELDFPRSDATNPEIARMWAQKRIDGLLKQADRAGSREPVLGEVVELGEQFSIVTEYTSFLVLENDAEYQRWKISRRNVERIGRDRAAQAEREAQLASLREKALTQLGPQAAVKPAEPMQMVSAAPLPQTALPAPATQPSNSQSRNLQLPRPSSGGGGSGPVGPLFVALVAWLARRMRQETIAS